MHLCQRNKLNHDTKKKSKVNVKLIHLLKFNFCLKTNDEMILVIINSALRREQNIYTNIYIEKKT